MAIILEVKNLKVEFNLNNKIIDAVNDVSFNIFEQEVLVLAGESGSGKSVTVLAITRVLPNNASIKQGLINYFGKDLLSLNENSLVKIRGKEIAYIFQEPVSYLNPVYTIGSQIIEAIMLHQNRSKKAAFEEAVSLLEMVMITDPKRVMFDYPHQLSGGMNQRVFIAMSLACKPKILIADEPTTSLDVTIEAEILKLLMDLKKKLGFSLLFITHNLSIAKRIADRVCVMYKGKVVECTDRSKLFSSPEHFHTKELIAAYEKIGRI